MSEWCLRPATSADVESIAELRAVVMRPDLERLGRYDEVRVRQRFRDGFDPAHTWVVEVELRFAGSVAVRRERDARWVEHFYLDPSVQGRGVGSEILASLLSRIDGPVRLNVLQGSPAIRLYERHGFVVESEDPIDIVMVRHQAGPLPPQ